MVNSARVGSQLTGLLAAAIVAGHAAAVGAAEQRCTELGANCSCSEPLNTNSFVLNNIFYNPQDSVTKGCSGEIWFGNSPGSGLSIDPESGMPSGNSVSWVWTQTGNDGH